jgi:acyl-CoA synthetase (AMP-forming)/AMP-acid ligase II
MRSGWVQASAVGRLLPHVPRLLPGSPWNAARLLERVAARLPERPALLWLDRCYRWGEVDARVNRCARALRALGVGPGDAVALLMDNRPEYLFAVTALSRLRAVAALVNNQIGGEALAHAIRVAGARRVLVGAEHAAKLEAVASELALDERDVWVWSDEGDPGPAGFGSFDAHLDAQSEAPVTGGMPRGDERMAYIYTSGTTGLPKAAIVTNQRFLGTGAGFGRAVFGASPQDVVYVTTPLYHSTAMYLGWASVLTTGAALALRRRFSASRFFEDVRRFDATIFVYIGELCRYLLNQPPHPDERSHRLRLAVGNGLRSDVWERFQERFHIPLVREFYGATEGNLPIVNYEGRPGMVGRLPWAGAVVRADPETGEVWRGRGGRCARVGVGETGLLLGRITRLYRFDGYADAEATRRKVVRDVFAPGDRWFDTGDLVALHPDRWIGFADRVGDTFRWKGENVSTQEVAEILNGAKGVLESNVYGVRVPGADGRAGMASLRCGDDFDIESFGAFVAERLTVHQRPYFVRLQKDMRITGTFKHQKVDYRAEGYDPQRVPDPLYFLRDGRYVPLDAEAFEAIRSGRIELR